MPAGRDAGRDDGGRLRDAQPDAPDLRDLVYRPPLAPQRRRLDPREASWWSPALVRDQGSDPSCTGHAVASCVDLLLAIEREEHGGEPRPDLPGAGTRPYASAIMLYGNAKLHDEWHGESYAGSSLRGALKGFQHNGVCSIVTARKQFNRREFDTPGSGRPTWRWRTSVEVHDEAMRVMLGVYMRVEPRLADMHAALIEARALVATVRMHEGWDAPAEDGRIVFDSERFALKTRDRDDRPSYHAVAIVGFDQAGFLVQNSWGPGWGSDGLAVWTYPDWAHNVVDVWAMRLGAPATDAFRYSIGAQGIAALADAGERGRRAPTRLDVLGHIVPVTNGRFVRYGRYHIDRDTLDGTFGIIEERLTDKDATSAGARAPGRPKPGTPWYRHVLVHFLGGTRDAERAGRMVRALHPVYTANGIYPLFVLWEEPLATEVRGDVARLLARLGDRVGPGRLRDPLAARLAELEIAEIPGRFRLAFESSAEAFMAGEGPLSDEGEAGDRAPAGGDGRLLFADLFERLRKRHRKGEVSYHFVAHDIGARLLAAFFRHHRHVTGDEPPVISSLHLVSPMLRREEFDAAIGPYLVAAADAPVRRGAKREAPLIEQARLWCLDQRIAAGDLFAESYPRSWPELWARVEALTVTGAIVEPIDDLGTRNDVGRTRLLALSSYAKELQKQAATDGYPVAVEPVGDVTGTQRLGLTHFEVDASVQVVGGILKAILGEGAVRRPYTEADFIGATGG